MSNFTASLPSSTEFHFWVGGEDAIMQEEELTISSHEEATKLFEQWQSEDDDMEILDEVDMQLGSNYLLHDATFNGAYGSSLEMPTSDLDLVGLEDATEVFFALSDDSSSSSESTELNEQYSETLRKLSESMKRSRETRKSLMMKTPKTERYARSNSVSGVISSIEKSSEQLQAYLESIRAISQ